MIQVSNWGEGYTVVNDFMLLCTFKDKVRNKYFKEPLTRLGVMYVLAQLIRRSIGLQSDTIEVTTSFVSKYTGLPDKTVRRYLQVLKDIKIISWDKKTDRKPRWITINYETLDKMYNKYQSEVASMENDQIQEGPKEDMKDMQPRMCEKEPDVDSVTTKIIELMVKHKSTVDMMFIDEIQEVCGNDEKLRRDCTRKAKEVIKKEKLITNE